MNTTRKFYSESFGKVRSDFELVTCAEVEGQPNIIVREVVWNESLENSQSWDAVNLYRTSQRNGLQRIDIGSTFAWNEREFREFIDEFNAAGITELTNSNSSSGLQMHIRILLEKGWKLSESVMLESATNGSGAKRPALLFVRENTIG